METRKEVDPLGERTLPKDVYYGIQTLRAVENFPVSGLKAPPIFNYSYVRVKRAAAVTNMKVDWLDSNVGNAIVKACDEVLSGQFLEQFVVDVFQAGAGTSFNMNVNEVLANRSLELLGKEKGDYKAVSPNDHVNLGQSTNDTFPTALHISTLTALQPLLSELETLAEAFEALSTRYSEIVKSGRTHLQDALPVTVGQEFGAYASAVRNACLQLHERQRLLFEVALGATAVGTAVNAHPRFKQLAIPELGHLCGFPLKPAGNPFEALQSCRAIQAVSSGLKELSLELIRVGNDLRLLSSGPTAGLAEIKLPPVQPGSSIMPGKVNPVLAECLNMVGFQVVAGDLAVSLATQAGQLELNVMTPVIMHNVLFSIGLLSNFLPIFRKRCVEGIVVDERRCAGYVERNPALATFLSPSVGYLEASKIAKEALEQGRSVKEIVAEKGIVKDEDLEKIFSKKHLLGEKENEKRGRTV